MWADLVGTSAALLTCSALLPQVYTTLATKNTIPLSLCMLILFFLGKLSWLIYGVWIGSVPISVSNAISLSLISVLLILKIWFDLRHSELSWAKADAV